MSGMAGLMPRGLALTLELLPAPTKAVVAAALAGVAADLCIASRAPAQCLSYYRVPYDEDVFQGAQGSEAVRTVEQGLARSGKPMRPIGWPALRRLSGARNVSIILVRNEGLASLLVLNRYFTSLYEEEEAADLQGREPNLPAFPTGELHAALRRGFFNACIDWAVQVTRSMLDWAATAAMPGLAHRLRKELRASAERKARYAWHARALRVARTALYSDATLYAADALVSGAVECLRAARWRHGSGRARLRLLALRCSLQGARSAAVLCAVSVGSGLGAAAPLNRSWAMFVWAQGASLLVNIYMAASIERIASASGPPPPGLPPPAGLKAGGGGSTGEEAGSRAGQDDDDEVDEFAFHLRPEAHQPPAEGLLELPPEVAQPPPGPAAAAPAGELADAGVQAGPPHPPPAAPDAAGAAEDAAEPPAPQEPAPQERRHPAGPRLPERPAPRRRGPLPPQGPQPPAPLTPQFREARPPPVGEGQGDVAAVVAARAAAEAALAGNAAGPAAAAAAAGAEDA